MHYQEVKPTKPYYGYGKTLLQLFSLIHDILLKTCDAHDMKIA